MSSTDASRDELALRFFKERLIRAAALLHARGARLLPDGPDRDAETYYIARASGEEYVFDLDVPLADALRSLWKDYPELAGLSDELSRLARDLRQEQASGEVSPFIYAMF